MRSLKFLIVGTLAVIIGLMLFSPVEGQSVDTFGPRLNDVETKVADLQRVSKNHEERIRSLEDQNDAEQLSQKAAGQPTTQSIATSAAQLESVPETNLLGTPVAAPSGGSLGTSVSTVSVATRPAVGYGSLGTSYSTSYSTPIVTRPVMRQAVRYSAPVVSVSEPVVTYSQPVVNYAYSTPVATRPVVSSPPRPVRPTYMAPSPVRGAIRSRYAPRTTPTSCYVDQYGNRICQ